MNLICKLFGHQTLMRDWYPSDPIFSISCRRCKKILQVGKNSNYNLNELKTIEMIYTSKDPSLTYGKTYRIITFRDSKYCVKNDKLEYFYYNYKHFISIPEYRKMKLQKLQNAK